MDKAYKGYRNLIAWQLANQLAHLVYDITASFPRNELFGLTSQMYRSALSVAANIALASLTELEYYIDFAFERKFYSKEVHSKLSAVQTESAKVLSGLIKSVRV